MVLYLYWIDYSYILASFPLEKADKIHSFFYTDVFLVSAATHHISPSYLSTPRQASSSHTASPTPLWLSSANIIVPHIKFQDEVFMW